MKGRRFPVLFTGLLSGIVGIALVVSPALARQDHHPSHPRTIPVSGQILLDPADNSTGTPEAQGAITVTPGDAQVTFTGRLKGKAHEAYFNVALPDGTILQYSKGSTFTGKVAGHWGTLSYVFSGDAANGGLITVTGGTGGLSGASGHILYYPEGESGGLIVFAYEGVVSFP
jgi:hypothetical protein